MKITKIEALEKIANDIRIGIIEQVYQAQSGSSRWGTFLCRYLSSFIFQSNEYRP